MAKQTYRVIGPHPIDDHAPGSVFEASFSEDQEAFLLSVGHIVKSSAQAKEAEPVVTQAALEAQRDEKEQDGS